MTNLQPLTCSYLGSWILWWGHGGAESVRGCLKQLWWSQEFSDDNPNLQVGGWDKLGGCDWHIYTAKLLQSCQTLCDPRDGSPPGSPIPGILQARTLEWLAISFSNASKWKVKVKSLRLSTWKLYSRVQLLATPWTAVYQAPLSMGFSRQEYWSGVPLPSPSIQCSHCQTKTGLCYFQL